MHKDSYKVILFSFLLICGAVRAFADDAVAAADNDSSVTHGETSIVLQTDETALPVQDVPTPRTSRSSTFSLLLQLIISLAAVCMLIYGVLYFIRRSKQFTAGDDPFLKNVANLPLAPNKTLYIVTKGSVNSSYVFPCGKTKGSRYKSLRLVFSQTAGTFAKLKRGTGR